ncbi:MAG TPA: hypothetical protein VGN97_11955 [Mesorhizobium sp.]|nr:hypothetical protein [Mesorhizobium sp.]
MASIAPETYRHWKKALGPLRRGRGHSPCFSSGDLVAVAVIRLLAVDMAVRVGALASVAESLFELCNQSPWPVLERAKLIVDLPEQRLQLRPELAEISSDRPTITIPLRPIVTRLREQLLAASDVEEQTTLRFPPTPVNVPGAAGRIRP